MRVLREFCTPGHGVPYSNEKTKPCDEVLLDHIRDTIIALTVDAASNEVAAGQDMAAPLPPRKNDGGEERAARLPKLRLLIRDKAHGIRQPIDYHELAPSCWAGMVHTAWGNSIINWTPQLNRRLMDTLEHAQVCKQKTYCCNKCWPRLSPQEEDQLKNKISKNFCHVDGCWNAPVANSDKCTFCNAGRISHLINRKWNDDHGWELQEEAKRGDSSIQWRGASQMAQTASQLALQNGDVPSRASGSGDDGRGAVESMPLATLSNMLEDMEPSELCKVLERAAVTLKRKLGE